MVHTHEIHHKEYETKAEIVEYLKQFYRPDIDRGVRVVEVYRTPGTFIHEFLTGALSVDQIVDTVKNHPEACFCCMDERVKVKGVVTSHKGCGAAAIAADLILNNPKIRAKYAEVVGADKTTRLITALKTARGEQLALAKDTVGAEWSKTIAEKAGVADSYAHLEVDDKHHYASMAVLDMCGNMMVDTEGEVGERPFMISNPKKVVEDVSREAAYNSLIDYGLLALQIARGAHSSLPAETTFTIAVVRNERVDQKLWDDLLKKKTTQLRQEWAREQAKKSPAERKELNFRFVTVMESDFQTALAR